MFLTRGGNSYTNDANGNTLTRGGRSSTWDGQNRLTQCVYSGTTTTHTYGFDGLRRRSVQGMNTTDYVLEGQSVVRSLLNGNVDRTYLHGPRGPEYERLGANDPVWYLYDGLGSVLGTVDKNGNIVSTRKFDVYGLVRGRTGPGGTKHKWVGGLGHPSEDETGLLYMRARFYDPTVGRFLSQDRAKDGTNWFTYCRSNPITSTDPSGESSMEDVGATNTASNELRLESGNVAMAVKNLAARVVRLGNLRGKLIEEIFEEQNGRADPSWLARAYGHLERLSKELASDSKALELLETMRKWLDLWQ